MWNHYFLVSQGTKSLALVRSWDSREGQVSQSAIARESELILRSVSAQRLHPVRNGVTDLVWRIFLDKMDTFDGHFDLCRPLADGIEIRAATKQRTWLSFQEQLRHITCRQPVCIGANDRGRVCGIALNGNLTRPTQSWSSSFTRFGERSSVFSHLLSGEGA